MRYRTPTLLLLITILLISGCAGSTRSSFVDGLTGQPAGGSIPVAPVNDMAGEQEELPVIATEHNEHDDIAYEAGLATREGLKQTPWGQACLLGLAGVAAFLERRQANKKKQAEKEKQDALDEATEAHHRALEAEDVNESVASELRRLMVEETEESPGGTIWIDNTEASIAMIDRLTKREG